MTIWFILVGLSLAYVTWHNLARNPVSWVQKLAWILVTAYTGPAGLLAYWFTCRTKKGMTHEESTQMTWQQGVNSEMHCVAGDATGIIFSAAVVYHFSLPNGIDLIIEYCSAFLVGLFVFQALMMINMYRGDYWLAVRKTIFAETVSMNMVMTGMLPVMVILMHVIPEGESPYNMSFWFIMGMATIAGGIIAFPINYWLVSRKLKHGCMTLRPEGESHQHRGSMGKITGLEQFVWVAGTFAILFLAAYLTTFVAPIKFS